MAININGKQLAPADEYYLPKHLLGALKDFNLQF